VRLVDDGVFVPEGIVDHGQLMYEVEK
jgi:hypothetical protein